MVFLKCCCRLRDLICYNLSLCVDILVKELDKRASGQAFEVLLNPSAPDAKGEFPLPTPKKKDVSLEEIQRKLDAAEERRKVIRPHTHTLMYTYAYASHKRP